MIVFQWNSLKSSTGTSPYVIVLTEDRPLCTLPSTSSLLTSPGEPGAEPATSGASLSEQDSVSIPEGTQIHTHTCTYLPNSLTTVGCFLFSLTFCWLFNFFFIRCIWGTFAGLQWQSGEGEIHHESHSCQLLAWQQLQPHPIPIVSHAFRLNQ